MKRNLIFSFVTIIAASNACAEDPVNDGVWRGLASASLAATSGNSTSHALLVNVDVARITEQDKIDALNGLVW